MLADRRRFVAAAGPWALVALLGVIYALLARVALRSFPFSGDEYSYFLQGELFARGLLRAPAPAHAELLRVDHVIIDQWVRSKYPPGTSALLALGIRAGVPWIVTPVEAVVALVAVWRTTLANLGARAGILGLLVLGLSPLFAYQAGTFFGHTAAIMWLALAFAATSRWLRTGGAGWALLAGAALGCGFLTRPGDALCFGAALLVLRSPRMVALTVLGALPFVGAYLAYQAAQFGSPFADGYHAYEPTFRAIYGEGSGHPISLGYLFDPKEQGNHLDVLRALATEWTIPGSVLLGVVGARAIRGDHPAKRLRDVAVAVALVPAAMLFVSVADPDDGARPRYLSTTLIALAFLAGPGWDAASESLRSLLGPALTRGLAVAALVAGPVQVGAFLGRRLPELWTREGLYEAVRDAGVIRGVVAVRAEWPTRYARNGPFFDRPVLYVSAPRDATMKEVAAAFPDRPAYEAIEGHPWKVVPFDETRDRGDGPASLLRSAGY